MERAAYDAKYVITTYEGKHNHDVPFYRRKHKITCTGGSVNELVGADGNTSIPILESQALAPQPEINNEFQMPNMVNNGNDMPYATTPHSGGSVAPVPSVPLLDLNLPPPENSSLDEHEVNAGASPMGPEA